MDSRTLFMVVALVCVASHYVVGFSVIHFDEYYNEATVERFNSNMTDFLENLDLVDQLGRIAYYARLRRAWGRSPTGERLNASAFPDTPGTLNGDLLSVCSKSITACIANVTQAVTSRFPELYEENEKFILNEKYFAGNHLDKMNHFDATFTYLFCFFAHNNLLLMRTLPYCTIGAEGEPRPPAPIRTDQWIFGWDANPYQCAIESFCPDPCCGLARNRMNCIKPAACSGGNSNSNSACRVPSEINRNFSGILINRWNTTCDCDRGYRYDYKKKECVDIDECKIDRGERMCQEAHEICINTPGKYLCACKIGARNNGTHCEEFSLRKKPWYGLAHQAACRYFVGIPLWLGLLFIAL
ncbi:hypothetical protein QR680_012385 [Steinernema hermaphroditum]|uniref:EGF-like domain-containing protein n=1 Tax=Steinernema hermaphroditum TaxID=289476 RepID=A0AA39I3G3_9BILA|nr:hypothetical protein QR680_012385 [Steinernema hermaphroditum]